MTSYINQTCPFILLLNYMYNKLTLFPTFFFQTPTCKLHEINTLSSSFQHQVDFELHVQKPYATFSLLSSLFLFKHQLVNYKNLPPFLPTRNTPPVPLTWLFGKQLCSAHVWPPQVWGRGTHDQPASCATGGGWSQHLQLWLPPSSSATH